MSLQRGIFVSLSMFPDDVSKPPIFSLLTVAFYLNIDTLVIILLMYCTFKL